jgi:hypothetical protein
VAPAQRRQYLQRLGELLAGHDLGGGIVARMARQAAAETRKARARTACRCAVRRGWLRAQGGQLTRSRPEPRHRLG